MGLVDCSVMEVWYSTNSTRTVAVVQKRWYSNRSNTAVV